jgi:hypothetical protein
MKGYPEGYPDPNNRHQVETARRHDRRRYGKPATAADVARIEAARHQRSGHAAAFARTAAEADLKRRQGLSLTPAERALLTNGDDQS